MEDYLWIEIIIDVVIDVIAPKDSHSTNMLQSQLVLVRHEEVGDTCPKRSCIEAFSCAEDLLE